MLCKRSLLEIGPIATGVLSIYFIESVWFGWNCNFYNIFFDIGCLNPCKHTIILKTTINLVLLLKKYDFFNELYVKNSIYFYFLHIHTHSYTIIRLLVHWNVNTSYTFIFFCACILFITSLCECVRTCWMWTHHTQSCFSAHAYYYVLVWMCKNMLIVNTSYTFIFFCACVLLRHCVNV